jgi:disulfide bond formation protein DsbB
VSEFFGRYGLYSAWLVAIVATGGSLYFSEVRHFIPCDLCWFQRILMYPLVILLGIASYRHDLGIARYVLPLSILGGLIAFYHYFVVERKLLGAVESPLCRPFAPCDAKWIEWAGFITIPFLSLVAFALITSFLLFVRRVVPQQEEGS